MFNFLDQNVPPWGLFFFGNEILFRHPRYFLLLFLIVFFAALVAWDWCRRKKALENPAVEIHLSASRVPTVWQSVKWWAYFSLAIALLVAARADPENVAVEWERVFGKIRITVIFDASISMKKAEDIPPNRFEAAKVMTRDLVAMLARDADLQGKYALSLIPFSGSALPYFLPFTTSGDEFLSVLDSLDIGVVTKKGTSLWAALRAYDELLLSSPVRDKDTLDLGILISDGGKEEGKKERSLLPKLVKDLRDPYRIPYFLMSGERVIIRSEKPRRNVHLNTVGVGKVMIKVDEFGNSKRVAVPTPLINRDKAGNLMSPRYEHLKEGDISSPVLTTALDEQILTQLATWGGGKYNHFTDRETILREFKRMILTHRGAETDRIPHKKYKSVRYWFLLPAFLIFYFLFGYGGWLVRLARVATKSVRSKSR